MEHGLDPWRRRGDSIPTTTGPGLAPCTIMSASATNQGSLISQNLHETKTLLECAASDAKYVWSHCGLDHVALGD